MSKHVPRTHKSVHNNFDNFLSLDTASHGGHDGVETWFFGRTWVICKKKKYCLKLGLANTYSNSQFFLLTGCLLCQTPFAIHRQNHSSSHPPTTTSEIFLRNHTCEFIRPHLRTHPTRLLYIGACCAFDPPGEDLRATASLYLSVSAVLVSTPPSLYLSPSTNRVTPCLILSLFCLNSFFI